MAMAESSELAQRLQRTLGDGFRVERELGGGGMSRVFLVEDIQLDRRIVVKVLPPELGASLSVERFRREIQLAAKLQHPHVVPLLTAGANEGLLYFAMPYIEGESLRARLAREHELPIQDSVRILRDVTDALAYAHAHGVVHRDIKPDNVLVSGHHALVTDFGVSKALANSAGASSITSVGIALGTPAYMSPEQAAADPAADHRADIYAVGVLGYELLTGRTPFGGLPPQQQLAAHVTTPTPHISQHRASLPPALAGVIMRCLEKKAADRWQTADELVEQFEALATPSGGLTPAGSPPHQRARLTSLRVGVAAAVVVVVGATSWLVWRRPSGYVVASTTQVTNTPGLELDATISPDGKLVAFAMGSVGHSRIYVKQIAGGSARALAESAAEPQRMPRWSPDGQQISFDVRQALYTSPALGGTPRQLMDASEYEFASPTLSPDGERIAYAREDGIYVRPVNGGDAVKIAAATWPNWPVWSPDGHRVAFVENNPWFLSSGAMLGNIAPSTIYVADVSARKAVAVTERVHLNTSPAWAGDGRALLYVSSRGGSRDIYRQGLTRRGEAQGAPIRLTTGANAHTVSVSADGSRLAYTALTTHSNIWWAPITPNGTTPFSSAKPLTNENQTVEALAVSPDGKWLAYDSNREGPQHIYKIPVNGGEPIQLTRDTADDFSPAWSGDGRFIAYHSWHTGNRDVFVVSADGTDPHDITRAPGHEMGPIVSRDSRKILFISDHTGRWEMYSMERQSNGAWSAPRQLTHNFGYRGRWSPDGSSLLYLSLIDSTFHVANADGSGDRLFFDGRAMGLTPEVGQYDPTGQMVYIRAVDRQGRYAFYAMPTRGGTPHLVLQFDDPSHQPRRSEFDTDGRRIFFTIASDESDVWVMELMRR
jgi:Tol biopolymer transport system component